MSDLTGKTAVITGAASGIGAAVARRFVLAGANVVAADLNQTGLDALCKELGSPVAAISGDVTDRAYLEALSALAIERFGAIDIAILNAAVDGPMRHILEIKPAEFEAVFKVNVRAVFEGIQVFGEAMKAHGGSMVLTSSVNGLRAFSHTSPYTTSKMAVMGLARAAANDLAEFDIRVNTVHPGLIDTPMLQRAEEGLAPGNTVELRQTLTRSVALKRVGMPGEIADAIAYLASDASSYITGTSLVVDGGFTTLLNM